MTRRKNSSPLMYSQRKPKARSQTPREPAASTPMVSSVASTNTVVDLASSFDMVPYDENLLERSRTQWQFGDWASLAAISRDTLQHHPDRAKLALLAAAGHQALGNAAEVRQYTRLAMDWGCSKKLVSQILIAGVYNTLGRAAAVSNQNDRAITHLQCAIATGSPGSDQRLILVARLNYQYGLIGLPVISVVTSITEKNHNKPTSITSKLTCLVEQVTNSVDLYAEADKILKNTLHDTADKFQFHLEMADHFISKKDKVTALHYLNNASELADDVEARFVSRLIKKMLAIGKTALASEIALTLAFKRTNDLVLSEQDKTTILASIQKTLQTVQVKFEHGHEVLLTYLAANMATIKAQTVGRKPVLIEIGTTRENIPGQGSTLKIASFCQKHGMHFITVDMDPHNTHAAVEAFRAMDVPFSAITAKGEDYLRTYTGTFDFIFLDAYDFDHGQHSEIRQSRYIKYLGNPIDDAACHQMHLECAQSINSKLAENGIVCMDDTWLEADHWTAKGTLAMPYMLANGFKVIEARNRAALLTRTGTKNDANV
jgi:hypothetical protein